MRAQIGTIVTGNASGALAKFIHNCFHMGKTIVSRSKADMLE
jgi:hypothetical protein